MPIVSCEQCGKPFNKIASRIERDNYHFCEKSCYLAYRKEHPGYFGRSKQRKSVSCDNCGKKVRRTPSSLENVNNVFCSHGCHSEYRRKRIKVQCGNCGKKLERTPFKLRRSENHFCSYSCRAQFQHRDKVSNAECAQCGEPLRRSPSRLKRRRNVFCSPECDSAWRSERMQGEQHPRWKGGGNEHVAYYGPNWHPQRRKARKRDNYTCQECGITEKDLGYELHVHHIIPFRDFGYVPSENKNYKQANKLSNLISLCGSCHMRAEHGSIPVQPSLL